MLQKSLNEKKKKKLVTLEYKHIEIDVLQYSISKPTVHFIFFYAIV